MWGWSRTPQNSSKSRETTKVPGAATGGTLVRPAGLARADHDAGGGQLLDRQRGEATLQPRAQVLDRARQRRLGLHVLTVGDDVLGRPADVGHLDRGLVAELREQLAIGADAVPVRRAG